MPDRQSARSVVCRTGGGQSTEFAVLRGWRGCAPGGRVELHKRKEQPCLSSSSASTTQPARATRWPSRPTRRGTGASPRLASAFSYSDGRRWASNEADREYCAPTRRRCATTRRHPRRRRRHSGDRRPVGATRAARPRRPDRRRARGRRVDASRSRPGGSCRAGPASVANGRRAPWRSPRAARPTRSDRHRWRRL